MTEFMKAVSSFPHPLKEVLDRLPVGVQNAVQEIRLRAGTPVVLSTREQEWILTTAGEVTERVDSRAFYCDQPMITDCFQALCDYSVHSHQQEIRQGYISTKTGCRAGLAGTAVVENGEIVSLRQISSICLRVARNHIGCADELIPHLISGGFLRSALLCGEPSSGKTSLLRDIARQLSSGRLGKRWRVVVVDERGELSAEGGLQTCDVLLYAPKGQGIQQAIRCLAPDLILFDELGTPQEVEAIKAGLHAGVTVIASAHCTGIEALRYRPVVTEALKTGAFDQVVWLSGRRSPGRIEQVVSAENCLIRLEERAFSRSSSVGGRDL